MVKPSSGVTVRFSMWGIEHAIEHDVSASEARRIGKYFCELAEDDGIKDFILFDTRDHTTTVIVRGREVSTLVCRRRAGKVRRRDDSPIPLLAFLRGAPGPLQAVIFEPSEAFCFVTALDAAPVPIPTVWPVLAYPGEFVAIAAPDVVVAEIDSSIVNQGMEEMKGLEPSIGDTELPF